MERFISLHPVFAWTDSNMAERKELGKKSVFALVSLFEKLNVEIHESNRRSSLEFRKSKGNQPTSTFVSYIGGNNRIDGRNGRNSKLSTNINKSETNVTHSQAHAKVEVLVTSAKATNHNAPSGAGKFKPFVARKIVQNSLFENEKRIKCDREFSIIADQIDIGEHEQDAYVNLQCIHEVTPPRSPQRSSSINVKKESTTLCPSDLEQSTTGLPKSLESSHQSEDETYDDNYHPYVNLLDIMKSGIMKHDPERDNKHVNVNTRADNNTSDDDSLSDEVPPRSDFCPLKPRLRTETIGSNSNGSDYSLDEHEGQYVTITKYEPVYLNLKRVNQNVCLSQFSSEDELHYKTLNVYDNDQKLRKTEISKVSLSKNKEEKEVQKFKDKKEYIVDELITTEEFYLKQLHYAISHYDKWLRSQIGNETTGRIFKNLSQILLETRELLQEIKDVRNDFEAIGRKFERNRNLFERYPVYIRNKKHSEAVCNKFEARIVAREIELQDPLGLSSHLLLPIQRLAKYEMLLKNLGKCLDKEKLPAEHIKGAINLIQSIAVKGNDIIELDLIQGKPYHFEKTGNLILRDNFKELSQLKCDIVLFLFKRKLIFTKKDNKIADNYLFMREIDVDSMAPISPETVQTTTFILEEFSRQKFGPKKLSFRLVAKNSDIKNKWVNEINKILWNQFNEVKRSNIQLYRPDLDII